jgi:hypothetical protein
VGFFDKGPGYTVRDLVFWVGAMAGILVAHFTLRALEVELQPILRIVVILVAAVTTGWLCETGYRLGTRPPKRDEPH